MAVLKGKVNVPWIKGLKYEVNYSHSYLLAEVTGIIQLQQQKVQKLMVRLKRVILPKINT